MAWNRRSYSLCARSISSRKRWQRSLCSLPVFTSFGRSMRISCMETLATRLARRCSSCCSAGSREMSKASAGGGNFCSGGGSDACGRRGLWWRGGCLGQRFGRRLGCAVPADNRTWGQRADSDVAVSGAADSPATSAVTADTAESPAPASSGEPPLESGARLPRPCRMTRRSSAVCAGWDCMAASEITGAGAGAASCAGAMSGGRRRVVRSGLLRRGP